MHDVNAFCLSQTIQGDLKRERVINTFENGKYTEHIEFFSRDSSRVGASLGFDGKIENGAWHHSGLSSRGEPIYEIWKHLNQ